MRLVLLRDHFIVAVPALTSPDVRAQDLIKGNVDAVVKTLTNWLWTAERPPRVKNILLYFGDDWAYDVRAH
jgi:hypothetical protein